ncbi:MCP four helix bundle domain-containing protein [Cupriavidus cauae]|uniref:methyl-accepting chemotaxis protein n=1 Tax=Cupriavidus TaxID=106589 RepID=UPI0011ECA70A|nr:MULTISPECIES: methyl-accepting chemotaxis protein [Cupriavidus]KAA0179412.1 HAMP domain-containing protein [Cupriavidus gilardii]MCA7086387.1 methyl-accepting chemotaxis protein [Cupriavidus sp. DB3]UZN52043.1 MCP four helix bundle domain-containing protein [Cupriavidus cauae]
MKNLGIGARLGIGFGVVLLLSTLMTGLGILRLQQVAERTHDMMQQPLAKERLVSDWYRYMHTSVRRTTAVAKSSDPTLGAFFANETKGSVKAIADLRDKIEPLLSTDAEKQAFQTILRVREPYNASRDKITKLKQEGLTDEANTVLEKEFVPAGDAYLAEIQKLLDIQRASIDATARDINAVYQTARNRLIGLGVLVLAIGIAFAVWLTRGITRPLHRAVHIARTVAAGDLSARIDVDSKDETGQLLQALAEMNGNLLRIVNEVRLGTEAIATGTGQIAAGNTDLSQRTEEQAASLQQTASSMEELTSIVRQNADNAKQASRLAVDASDIAVKGGTVVGQVVDTMDEIHGASKKVTDIIAVIESIAFQTNILALNAAVEAARAGEQGRGFAVVAGEVRSLAQRSATAAKEIKSLIDDSAERVEKGSQLVSEAGQTMEEIVGAVKRVTDIMGEISAASAEQSAGIEQVNQAVTQMDTVTQQNAALVEQAAAAAGSLEEQAQRLKQAVSTFRLGTAQMTLA